MAVLIKVIGVGRHRPPQAAPFSRQGFLNCVTREIEHAFLSVLDCGILQPDVKPVFLTSLGCWIVTWGCERR